MLREIPTLDHVLERYAADLAEDFTAYRNHTYRVVNLCLAFAPADATQVEKVSLAAAFHDLGVWTDHTFDYLSPSARLAYAHLIACGRQSWIPEIREMILKHHKVLPYRDDRLVEQFRRADWIDISKGFFKFGLPPQRVKDVLSMWPDAGFHKRLLSLGLQRLRTHPWNPLPMIRL